jgi:predicted transcriptional regulator
MLNDDEVLAREIDAMPKEPPIGVRFQSDVKAALEKLAKAEDRTIGNLVNRIVAEYLRAKKLIK